MLQGHVAGKNFMRCSHEGACCGDGFLKCSHGGSCCRHISWFRFLIGLFSEVSHEQFTRGDLAFNRGVTLFCRRDMSPIQTDLNSGDMSWRQNFVPATIFFMKIARSHDGSLQHVPSCEPTFSTPCECLQGSGSVHGALRVQQNEIAQQTWHISILIDELNYSQARPENTTEQLAKPGALHGSTHTTFRYFGGIWGMFSRSRHMKPALHSGKKPEF